MFLDNSSQGHKCRVTWSWGENAEGSILNASSIALGCCKGEIREALDREEGPRGVILEDWHVTMSYPLSIDCGGARLVCVCVCLYVSVKDLNNLLVSCFSV